MFCSQKKSVHRLSVKQALSLVLTSHPKFPLEAGIMALGSPQGPPGRAGLCLRLAPLAQLLSFRPGCEGRAVWNVGKAEALWPLCLDAVFKLSPCPHGLPKSWFLCQAMPSLTQILTHGLLILPWSRVFLMTWTCLMATVADLTTMAGTYPDLAVPTWLPDLASDPSHLCDLVRLSQLLAGCHQTYPTHLLWVLHCLLGMVLPALLHTLPSVIEVLIPGSWCFFNFHCLPSKSFELILWY